MSVKFVESRKIHQYDTQGCKQSKDLITIAFYGFCERSARLKTMQSKPRHKTDVANIKNLESWAGLALGAASPLDCAAKLGRLLLVAEEGGGTPPPPPRRRPAAAPPPRMAEEEEDWSDTEVTEDSEKNEA